MKNFRISVNDIYDWVGATGSGNINLELYEIGSTYSITETSNFLTFICNDSLQLTLPAITSTTRIVAVNNNYGATVSVLPTGLDTIREDTILEIIYKNSTAMLQSSYTTKNWTII